jgi:hypothetical protein
MFLQCLADLGFNPLGTMDAFVAGLWILENSTVSIAKKNGDPRIAIPT